MKNTEPKQQFNNVFSLISDDGGAIQYLFDIDCLMQTTEIALNGGDGAELEDKDRQALATTLKVAREKLSSALEMLEINLSKIKVA